MNILWFQHVEHEDLGTLDAFLEEIDVLPVRVSIHYGGLVPADPGAYDAVISMGGPMSVHDRERYSWIDQETTLLRRTLEKGTPILGVCLGAQLLAVAAGGQVRPCPKAEIGWGEIELTEEGVADPLFAGCPRRFEVLHWHGETFDIPPGAVRLAGSADCPNQAFRLGDHAYGFQFHIEATSEMVSCWAADNAAWIRRFPHVNIDHILAQTPTKAAAMESLARRIYRNWVVAIGHAGQLEGVS